MLAAILCTRPKPAAPGQIHAMEGSAGEVTGKKKRRKPGIFGGQLDPSSAEGSGRRFESEREQPKPKRQTRLTARQLDEIEARAEKIARESTIARQQVIRKKTPEELAVDKAKARAARQLDDAIAQLEKRANLDDAERKRLRTLKKRKALALLLLS